MVVAGLSHALLAAAMVAMLLTPSSVDAALTFPKCEPNGSGCCTLGSSLMKSPGYAVVRMDADTIVTCSHGKLQCFLGNPNLRATQEGREKIDCPDFASLEESRSEIEFLDGVKETTTSKTTVDGPATVHGVGSA